MLHLLFTNYVIKLFQLMVIYHIFHVILHASEQLNLQYEKAGYNQSMISLNLSSVSTITKPKFVFSSKEPIIKAEILQGLNPLMHNVPKWSDTL